MIISSVKKIPSSGIAQYAWRRLAQFSNTEFTSNIICKLHNLDSSQVNNSKKQAEQIKYCLIQAKEYYDASKLVSLATRPVLLYYCTMSLALAEILLKQDARSRLSRLRSEHNCHGLALSMSSEPIWSDSLIEASSKMYAKAQLGANGNPKGTFEVWRRSAREHPVGGELTHLYEGANSVGYQLLLTAADDPPPQLPTEGINLHSCLVNLPYMEDTLLRWGSELRMVHATIRATVNEKNQTHRTTLAIHPTNKEILDAFGELCKIHPSYVNHMIITEIPNAYILEWPSFEADMSLPHSTCINTNDIYFTCSTENLGEFGYLYTAIHILGNFARYYPDLWIKHIEKNSALANTAEDLCNHALERLPLLSLSELSRTYLVIGD